MHQYKKFKERAFALPTLVIVSTILLIAGMSSLQAASSIGKSLQDIRWNSLANSAAEAGINYAASCLEEDAEVYEDWGSSPLKPNTNCEGGSPSGSVYIESDENGRWRSTFSVANISQEGYDPPKIVSSGTVQRLNSSGGVIKTYQAKKDILLNLPTSGNPLYASGFGNPAGSAAGSLCAVGLDSQSYCTGDNSYGQLGNGNITSQNIGVKFILPAGLTVKSFMTGMHHACALASDNQVYCAGIGTQGALGNGSTSSQSTPVKFNLLAGLSARSIATGSYFTCALASDNQVYCAGWNPSGQLGNGNTTNQSTPVKFNLPAGLTARSVSVQGSSTCALASDNQVYCAGNNGLGQLGNGTTTNQSTPVKFNLPAGLTARSVDTGGSWYPNHICVLTSNNQVYCSGQGDSGQLGDGGGVNRSTPVKFDLTGGLTARSISVGYRSTCAIASDNQAYCAGYSWDGQLGNGTIHSSSSTPVKFNLPSGLTARLVETSAGAWENTCVIGSNNQLYCAGNNDYGQLGDGTTSARSTPVRFNIPSGLSVRAITLSGLRTCANVSNGIVYCAGLDDNGSLGTGTPNQNYSTPTPYLY